MIRKNSIKKVKRLPNLKLIRNSMKASRQKNIIKINKNKLRMAKIIDRQNMKRNKAIMKNPNLTIFNILKI
jgi:hypothetical protein